MPHQEWRMFGLRVATLFGVCVAHVMPSAALDDASPPRVKIQGGPAEKGRKPVAAAAAAYEASRRAYEALSLADRKSVQESLVWVADYKGSLDGTFGKRTRDALVAFEKRDKSLDKDGVVDRRKLALLRAAAKRAKDGAGFTIVADKASGMSLGLPLKLLTKRTAVTGGARYASADYGFVVETARRAPEGGLAELYDKLSADKDDRKVTYKASKADWFVVSGETGKDGDKHFYSRFERKPGAETGEVHGYTVLYDSARTAAFDRYAIAIANSVEPFPRAEAVAALDKASTTAAKPPDAVPQPPVVPQPPRARFTATAVVFAPGKAVSVLPEACTGARSGDRQLKVATRDAGSGLVVLDVAGGRPVGSVVRDPAMAGGESVVVVGYAAAGDGPVLGVASGEVEPRGGSGGDKGEARIFAPLQDNAVGSAVFDRRGGFRGIIGRTSSKPRLVAGIVPQASYPLLLRKALERVLADATPAPVKAGADRKHTAGEIAAAVADSLIAIDCVQ